MAEWYKHFDFRHKSELSSICLFQEKKTIIVDVRQSNRISDSIKILNDLNFSKIKDVQVIIVGYLFKQSDFITKKIINSKNAIYFTCYEEDESDVKNHLKREFTKLNINLNELQIKAVVGYQAKEWSKEFDTFQKYNLYLRTFCSEASP